MTQEIKERLEQAAAYHQGSGLDFMAGAKTILENPSEWGLTYPHSQKLAEEVLSMQSQLAKYRDAFDSILDMPKQDYTLTKVQEIIREAHKQEGTK